MNHRKILGIALFFSGMSFIFLLLFFFWKLLAPFAVSYVFYFAMKPFLSFFEQRGVSHIQSVCIVFISFFGGFILFLIFMIPAVFNEFMSIRDNLGTYIISLNSFFDSLKKSIVSVPFGSMLLQQSDSLFSPSSTHIAPFIQSAIKNIPSLLSSILLSIMVIPFATFFFLLDSRLISHRLIRCVPNQYFEATLNLLFNLNLQFGLILRGMFISVLIISALSSTGLWVIGLKYPILIGFFSGISNLIPYAGPIVGIIGAFISAVMTGSPPSMFISIVIVFFLVQLLDNVFVQPVVMSKSTNIHPLLVLFLVMFGSRFGGVAGMFLIVPMVSLSAVVFRVVLSELNRPHRPDFSLFLEKNS